MVGSIGPHHISKSLSLVFKLPSILKHFETGAAASSSCDCDAGIFRREFMASFAMGLCAASVLFSWGCLSEFDKPRLLLRPGACLASPSRLSTWRLVMHYIIRRKQVSMAAVGLIHSVFSAMKATRKCLQVGWAYTRPILALVVNVVAFWNRPNKPLVGDAVGWPSKLVMDDEGSVASGELAAYPLPTSGLLVQLKLLCEAIKQRSWWSSCSHSWSSFCLSQRNCQP